MSRSFTVSAAPDGAFTVPADAVAVIDTAAEAAPAIGVGAVVADAAAMDRPFALSGGEEIEEMGGPNSLFSTQFGYEDFAVSGPVHGAITVAGTLNTVSVRTFPNENTSVLARASGGPVSVTLSTTGPGTRQVRYLVGTIADTLKIGTPGFMGATYANGASVTVSVPSGQRITFLASAGSGDTYVTALCNHPGETIYGAPRPVPAPKARVFDPAGRHAALGTLDHAKLAFKVRRAGAPADEALTAVVRKGMPATQPAVSAVALDGDGDPVAFRFDRLHPIGRALDGRPFVVAPGGLRLMLNDGSRVTVPANRVARWRGAELLVVKAAGQVPSRVVALTHGMDYALAAGVAPPDFTSWPGAVTEGAGLTLRTQFESLHIYLQSADMAATEVRFRKQGAADWFAAQPLVHDPRDPAALTHSYMDHTGTVRATTMAETTPGNHRNLIAHLAPATTYEVEVRQGAKLWRATATTRSYKPAKAGAALGTVDGDVTVTRSGDVVTVTRAGLPALTITAPAGVYAEIHSGLVRGGGVTLDCERVILRDVDVIAAPASAVTCTRKARDIRIVRGRIASWGRKDNVVGAENYRAANVGWSYRYDCAIRANYEWTSTSDLAVIGLRTGAPRHPANHWNHYNPSVGSGHIVSRGNHPWGSVFVLTRLGSFLGGNALMDCSFAGSSLRPCEDGLMGTNNSAKTAGGWGPNSVVSHCYLTGVTDDALEMDGSNQNLLVLGNWVDMERGVEWVVGPVAGVSVAVGYWGPTVARRNVFRYRLRRPELKTFNVNVNEKKEESTAFKIKRTQADETGMVIVDHNSVLPSETAPGREGCREFMAQHAPVRQITGRNNFARITLSTAIPAMTGTDVVWTGNDILRDTTAPVTFAADSANPLAGTVAAVPTLANVNDGGPWGAAAARAGAGL